MITIDIDKAKAITHDKRREARSKEFEPYDNIIMKQIPGNDYTQAEVKRQEIREKYSVIQEDIDSCNTAEDLKAIIDQL